MNYLLKILKAHKANACPKKIEYYLLSYLINFSLTFTVASIWGRRAPPQEV